MSLEKAIEYRKEKRKAYRGSKAFDYTCRNHGSCNYCESNRTIQSKRAKGRLEGQEDEFYGEFSLADPHDSICPDCEKQNGFCDYCRDSLE